MISYLAPPNLRLAPLWRIVGASVYDVITNVALCFKMHDAVFGKMSDSSVRNQKIIGMRYLQRTRYKWLLFFLRLVRARNFIGISSIKKVPLRVTLHRVVLYSVQCWVCTKCNSKPHEATWFFASFLCFLHAGVNLIIENTKILFTLIRIALHCTQGKPGGTAAYTKWLS